MYLHLKNGIQISPLTLQPNVFFPSWVMEGKIVGGGAVFLHWILTNERKIKNTQKGILRMVFIGGVRL